LFNPFRVAISRRHFIPPVALGAMHGLTNSWSRNGIKKDVKSILLTVLKCLPVAKISFLKPLIKITDPKGIEP
jgi:hypothetical protein